jgi:hypothetical protein
MTPLPNRDWTSKVNNRTLPVSTVFLSLHWLLVMLTCLLVGAGLHVARTTFTVKLAKKSGEVTAAELKICVMGGVAKNLTDKLSSTNSLPLSSFFFLLARVVVDFRFPNILQRSELRSRSLERLSVRRRR